MLPWYLLDASDSSLCIVNEKNILQAGQGIEINDKVRFFYQGKEYDGIVLAKNDDPSILENKMKVLLKAPRKKATATSSSPKGKRPIVTTKSYGTSSKKQKADKPPALSEEESSRLRILGLNKKEAERRLNATILTKTVPTRKEADPEWNPNEDSMDSIVDTRSHDKELKNSHRDIMRDLEKSSPEKDNSHDDPFLTPTPSPSKDELKKQLELLRKQLMVTGKDSVPSSSTATNPKKDDNGNVPKPSIIPQKVAPHTKDDGKKTKDPIGSDGDETPASHSESNENSFNTEKEEEEFGVDSPDEMLEYQLYGKGEDTTLLCAGIYCKSDAFAKAVTASTNVNHLLRRLMAGVFKPSQIQDCTVTGATWHAGGEAHLKAIKKPLHPGALKAIVDFSNSIAKKRKWSTKKTEKAKPVFATKLTEMKKLFKEGKLKD